MRSIISSLAVAVTFVLAACDHQKPDWSPANKRIGVVVIEYVGEKTVDEDRLRSLLHSAVGSAYTTETVDTDIRALYESGYIDDVRVIEEPIGGEVRLIFEVTTRPGFGPPLFIGNTAFSDQRIGRELDFGADSKVEDLTDEFFKAHAAKVEEFYRREGYPEARVTFRAFGGGPATPDDFQFFIEEGEKQSPR